MDREKVIKALEYCRDNELVNDCNKCDYGGKTGVFCIGMINDVLTLLKEQEAVEPTYEDFFGNRVARCGNCNGYVVRYKYCPGCGRQVKWDD